MEVPGFFTELCHQFMLGEHRRKMSSTLILFIFGLGVTGVSATLVQPEWKIYYNITTNQTIDVIGTDNPRINLYQMKAAPKVLRIGFGPIPCTCQGLTCGCCAGINVAYFDFNRRSCMNFTYDPYEFSLQLNMFLDNETVVSQRVSAKNPPPACMPVPLPIPIAPPLDMCVKFYNIHTPGYNIFMCMDFETRIARAPVLILHFDCLKMGADGVHHQKPEDAEMELEIEDADSETSSPIEVYDEVFEEDMRNKTMKVGKQNVTNSS